jgi:hypothetical protein
LANTTTSWVGLDNETWRVSLHAQHALEEFVPNNIALPDTIKVFAWHIAKWGNIRTYKKKESESFIAAASGLWELRHEIVPFFHVTFRSDAEPHPEEVCRLWEVLVQAMTKYGIPKQQYSWSSKMLHWLVPTCFPIYDSVIRKRLHISGHFGRRAYREIISTEYDYARSLLDEADSVVGAIEPRTLLRALDKYLWFHR